MMVENYKKMIRPLDVVLICCFLLVSFVPIGVFVWQQMHVLEGADLYAVVMINGREIDRFRLHEDAALLYIYTFEHGLAGEQYNLVEIDGHYIRVQRDNSPDQIGVNMGWISRPGQTIVVLPHRFLIRIEAVDGYEDDIIIPF